MGLIASLQLVNDQIHGTTGEFKALVVRSRFPEGSMESEYTTALAIEVYGIQ